MTTHRMSKTSIFKSWCGMRERCKGYCDLTKRNYVDKGIKVCERWLKFENFLEDMSPKPDKTEIDRIDGTKGYYKENCRWVTKNHNLANKTYSNKSNLPRGVGKAYNSKTYKARIKINNKLVHIGSFKTIEEARDAYNKMFEKRHGELPPEYRSSKKVVSVNTTCSNSSEDK